MYSDKLNILIQRIFYISQYNKIANLEMNKFFFW